MVQEFKQIGLIGVTCGAGTSESECRGMAGPYYLFTIRALTSSMFKLSLLATLETYKRYKLV